MDVQPYNITRGKEKQHKNLKNQCIKLPHICDLFYSKKYITAPDDSQSEETSNSMFNNSLKESSKWVKESP